MKYSQRRNKMVSQQIESRNIKDKDVLHAMRTVPRHLFVSDDLLEKAYCDTPLPIGFQQTISQPYMVALMTEALQLKANHKVLEIGTGCGYQTAVLAEIVNDIYSVEIIPELAMLAKINLQKLNYQNIHCKQGDGLSDWQEQGPFDRIIVTAAPRTIPKALIAQLKVAGRMIIPAGTYPQCLYCIIRKSENEIEQQVLAQVLFVAMTGKVENTGL